MRKRDHSLQSCGLPRGFLEKSRGKDFRKRKGWGRGRVKKMKKGSSNLKEVKIF